MHGSRFSALAEMLRWVTLIGLSTFACRDAVEPEGAIPSASPSLAVIPQQLFPGAALAGSPNATWLARDELGSAAVAPTNALAAGPPGSSSVGNIIVPNAFTTVMGNEENTYPHAWANMRYQQVFLESELAGLRSVGRLCLRRDEEFGGPPETQQLTVKLGPSTRDHTNLGSSFADNYSAPPLTVFSGQVALPASSGGGSPGAFFVCIDFTSSYVHTPGRNLIVEIANTSATSIPHFEDACFATLGCTTRRAVAYSSTATVASFIDDGGLIMRLDRGSPTTKDDCKNEGWENFGFANQGLCVRFIETGEDAR